MKRFLGLCFVILSFTTQVLWSLHIETIEELPAEETQKFIRHASTLIEDGDGQLMVCYYHGTFEGTTDQEIYLQTWSPKHQKWSGARGFRERNASKIFDYLQLYKSNAMLRLFYMLYSFN